MLIVTLNLKNVENFKDFDHIFKWKSFCGTKPHANWKMTCQSQLSSQLASNYTVRPDSPHYYGDSNNAHLEASKQDFSNQ